MNMQALSVLIVEDDLSFALELEMIVQDIGYQVAGVVDNAAATLEILFAREVDFILMDIDIKGELTGIGIGQKIRHLGIPILYITSFGDDEHYAEAQKSNISGYLVKPVDKYTLRTAIGLALSKTTAEQKAVKQQMTEEFIRNNYLFIRKGKIYEKVAQEAIALVEGADDYIKLWSSNGQSYLLRKTMRTMEKMLANWSFLRVHRSYIVNVKLIEAIDFSRNEIQLLGRQIPVSRQKRQELEQIIRKLE